jgi:hypothetical protein
MDRFGEGVHEGYEIPGKRVRFCGNDCFAEDLDGGFILERRYEIIHELG